MRPVSGRRERHVPAVLAVVLLAVLGVAGAAVVAKPARADGDPASDVLLEQNVFLPVTRTVSPAYSGLLMRTVAAVGRAAFPLKVALISEPQDLGAIPQLFGSPERYARFLDVEISYNSSPRLLVVMPQGFGVVGVGPVSGLSGISIDRAQGADGLARAAIEAVAVLADHFGHPIPKPLLPAVGGAGVGSGSEVPAGILGAVALLLGVLAVLGFRRWRRARVGPS